MLQDSETDKRMGGDQFHTRETRTLIVP